MIPIAILANTLGLLSPGGLLVAMTPAVWPLHGLPLDCCRLLRDGYREFGKPRGLMLDRRSFVYVGLTDEFRDGSGRGAPAGWVALAVAERLLAGDT